MSGTEDAAPEAPAIDRLVRKLRAARAQGGGVEFLVDADSAAALLGELHLLRGRVEHAAWQAGAIGRLMDRLAERDGEIAALRARGGSTPPAAATLEAVRAKHPPAPPVGPGDDLGSRRWAFLAIFAGLAIWVVLS
jgi:hypothetical protein